MTNTDMTGGEALQLVKGMQEKVADLEGLVFAETNAKQAALDRVAALEADKARIAELERLLREARELIEHGDFREGHCMCGSAVNGHTMGDGHSPVDAGVYYAGQAMERIDAALAHQTNQH